jgi:hypothetical protein
MGAGKKKPAAVGGRPKSAAASSGAASAAAAAPRALPYSLKAKKGGRQLEVAVQIPRSTPDSVLNVNADESGLRVDTGTWGGGYACQMEWPAPYAGKVRAGKDIEVSGTRSRPQRVKRTRKRPAAGLSGGAESAPSALAPTSVALAPAAHVWELVSV